MLKREFEQIAGFHFVSSVTGKVGVCTDVYSIVICKEVSTEERHYVLLFCL